MATVVRSNSLSSLTQGFHSENASESLRHELSRLYNTIPENERPDIKRDCENFALLFDQYLDERGTKLDWSKISPPREGTIVPYADLPPVGADFAKNLDKLAVLKLNGGLGTSMGCVGPKSAISVRNDLTFLDLCVRQIEHLNEIHDVDVPLVLMNSFNTDEDTSKILRKYKAKRVTVKTFNQSRFPRMLKETLQPLPQNNKNESEWYPPGHGDLYKALYTTGTLQQLLDSGKEWIFISNIDNLGAVVDPRIMEYAFDPKNKCDFLVEVTDKTRADVKGGTLIDYEGQTRLLEVAQVPKNHEEDFKSVTKFRVFNTNNLWVNLKAMKDLVERDAIQMEVIENKKSLDDGRVIIQLEQAVGAAIRNFGGARGLNVPRSRFLPVKKTSDLLLVMSNLYNLKHGTLEMNPARLFGDVPLIKLGDDHFKKVKDFLSRFETIPDIIELDHLTVSGNVRFGKNVILRGTVIIIAQENDVIDIPQGSVLENKIVTGNLRILDH